MGNLFETDFVYIKSPSSDQYIDDDKKIISDNGFRNLHHQPSTINRINAAPQWKNLSVVKQVVISSHKHDSNNV
jgi:hypothetical protein